MSPAQVAEFEAMYDPAAEVVGRERASDADFEMFGFYVMNNVGIAFRVFASGLLAGIGTAFFLVFNGVHIGAVAGHLLQRGFHDTFLTLWWDTAPSSSPPSSSPGPPGSCSAPASWRPVTSPAPRA